MKKSSIAGILLTMLVIPLLLFTACHKAPESVLCEAAEEEKVAEIETAKKKIAAKVEAVKKEATAGSEEAKKEAESINLIIEKKRDMIMELLMNPQAIVKLTSPEEVELIWIDMSLFDFTSDGKREIILSKAYVTNTSKGPVVYHYVYDREGNILFEFLGGSIADTTICSDNDKMKFYICSGIPYGSQNRMLLYTKVVKNEEWEKETTIGVWDTRKAGKVNSEDSYCIFYISAEEEKEIFFREPYSKIVEIAREEKRRVDEEQLVEYLKSYEELEEKEAHISCALYCAQDRIILESKKSKEKVLFQDAEDELCPP